MSGERRVRRGETGSELCQRDGEVELCSAFSPPRRLSSGTPEKRQVGAGDRNLCLNLSKTLTNTSYLPFFLLFFFPFLFFF